MEVEGEETERSMILLPLVGDRVMIFDVEDVKKLRKLGILGVLTGTLPSAPQQNVFHGIPLELGIHEVIWLVENGHGTIIDSRKMHEEVEKQLKSEMSRQNNERVIGDFTHIPNSPCVNSAHSNNLVGVVGLSEFIVSRCPTNEALRALLTDYFVFRLVRENGYQVMPGLRFGGDMIAYPGDPLRYHSHLIVRPLRGPVNLLDIVAGGRLATGVKKVWVIGGFLQEDKTRIQEIASEEESIDHILESEVKPISFSIEWAGFG